MKCALAGQSKLIKSDLMNATFFIVFYLFCAHHFSGVRLFDSQVDDEQEALVIGLLKSIHQRPSCIIYIFSRIM